MIHLMTMINSVVSSRLDTCQTYCGKFIKIHIAVIYLKGIWRKVYGAQRKLGKRVMEHQIVYNQLYGS